MLTVHLADPAATEQWGRCLAEVLQPGLFIALIGDLGAGKTSLSQAIAHGLGIAEPVQSPTFTLMNQYRGRVTLYHLDLYRLEDAEQVWELGWEEIVEGDGVCLVEWADKFPSVWPDEYMSITLSDSHADGGRQAVIKVHGDRYLRLLKEMKEHCSF
ncbi:MAG: tRNA (adenosine(37)-N6)-threonylcarbamoyltransferase complex ATPase subunit type 1 TsaE [Bacillota bacterium]